jgi:hypothetical protein
MSSNQNSKNAKNSNATVTCITSVATLERRLDDCVGSEDSVVVIPALVATRKPAAVRVLASLLGCTGPIAEESIAGLVTLGETFGQVVGAMRECVESDHYESIRHGHRVLAALGHEESVQWLRQDDEERIGVYLESKGITEQQGELLRGLVANGSEDEEGVA